VGITGKDLWDVLQEVQRSVTRGAVGAGAGGIFGEVRRAELAGVNLQLLQYV
jgi:hypothetical protein